MTNSKRALCYVPGVYALVKQRLGLKGHPTGVCKRCLGVAPGRCPGALAVSRGGVEGTPSPHAVAGNPEHQTRCTWELK